MILLFLMLFWGPVCLGFPSGWNEDHQVVCAGRDFRVPVYSRSRAVTFTPSSPKGPRRVLLENNDLKDQRYEWMRDMTLLVREVTHADQGLYAIKSFSTGFTYETIQLTVSECIRKIKRHYGETLKLNIPKEGTILEFYPLKSPPFSHFLTPSPSLSPSLAPFSPLVLWNHTDPEGNERGRGQVKDGYWVTDGLLPIDQGNYTIKDSDGKVLSRASLVVTAHSFNLTLFSKESLFLMLFVPVGRARLLFKPSSSSPFHSSVLLQNGYIVEDDPLYQGRLSLERNSTGTFVIIAMLSEKDDGTYDLYDGEGTLVSSTLLRVKDKHIRWRAVIKSITVPSGMFASLAGFILFMKRYPSCSINKIFSGLRDRDNTPSVNRPRILVQDCHDIVNYSSSPRSGRSKWLSSPSHTAYTPITENSQSKLSLPVRGPEKEGGVRRNSAVSHSIVDEAASEEKVSFSLSEASDCLRSSESCAQFKMENKAGAKKAGKEKDFFSTLPLDTDTSDICTVYTSNKLNFLK